MNEKSECPIWGTPASVKSLDIEFLKIIDSPRAGGRYSISEQAITLLPQIDDRVKARLTTWLVDQRRLFAFCTSLLSAHRCFQDYCLTESEIVLYFLCVSQTGE